MVIFVSLVASTSVRAQATASTPDTGSVSWELAFRNANATLAGAYPYTTWKRIDWTALATRFGPRISAAAAQRDARAFYLALRAYRSGPGFLNN